MSRKTYSPVQVRNPTSLQHLAIMRPGQKLELHLDHNIFPGKINVEISSDYLSLANLVKRDNRDICHIGHDVFVFDWAKYSHAMLGEIWIDATDQLSKVLVVMDCLNINKTRNFTVINPDCYDVRVKPYNVLEVILFNQNFGGNDEWNWEWYPVSDVRIEEIGCRSLNLYTSAQFASYGTDSPNYIYAKHPRFKDDVQPWSKQHHFWFRFDRSVLELLKQDLGIDHVGNLKFTGYSNRYCKPSCDTVIHNMSIYVDLRSKFENMTKGTLCLEKEEDCPSETTKDYNYSKSVSSSGSIVHLKKYSKKKIRYRTLPIKKEIGISKLPFASLEDGCKVLSCSPEMAQLPDDDEFYVYEESDYRPRIWKDLYRGALHGPGRMDHWD